MKLIEKFIELLEAGDHKDPEALVHLRLKKMGYTPSCSRCGGSGIFANYGTCFLCGGHGQGKYKLTKVLYAEVEKGVQEGRLKQYLEDLKNQQIIDQADKILFNLYNGNSQIAKDYSTNYNKDRFNMNQFLVDTRFKQSDIYNKFKKQNDLTIKLHIKNRRGGGYKNGTDKEREISKLVTIATFEACKKELIELEKGYTDFKEMIRNGYFDKEE